MKVLSHLINFYSSERPQERTAPVTSAPEPAEPRETYTPAARASEGGSVSQVSTPQAGPVIGKAEKDLLLSACVSRQGVLSQMVRDYGDGPGDYEVAESRQTFHDPSRGRTVPVRSYFPKDAEPGEKFPVVVVSHGLAGNDTTYRYLSRQLASHGYVVLQPTHEGSDTKAVMTRTVVGAFHEGELKHRAADVSFCLDQLEKGGFEKGLKDLADLDKVALAGHSFGALTTQAMAGLPFRDGSEPLKDERLDAFIALSPYGDSLPTHLLGLDSQGYDQIQQPILYMSGEKDHMFTLEQGSAAHLTPYIESASEDKYHVMIDGGRHLDFGQVFGLANHKLSKMVRSTSVAFLDAHLKEKPEARRYLEEGGLVEDARKGDALAFVGAQDTGRASAVAQGEANSRTLVGKLLPPLISGGLGLIGRVL